jgi:hypothetical protein
LDYFLNLVEHAEDMRLFKGDLEKKEMREIGELVGYDRDG